MSKTSSRRCPACGELKSFRIDQKTCGCQKAKGQVSEISGDKWTISLPSTRIHTLEQLIEFCDIDLTEWEVERFIANKWEVGANLQDGKGITVEPLFQVKAFLKRKNDAIFLRKEVEELKQLAKRNAQLPTKIARVRQTKTGYMLEINLTDHHFGKMAWGEETGYENYDIKIAEKVFWRAFSSILERVKGYEFEEIWFVVGNDLFNSDDVEGRTTKGTYVTTDARYQKTFAVVRTVMVNAIEQLRTYTRLVKVIMVSGNHDQLGVWHLGDSLECYFHKYNDVSIDNTPRFRKYHSFGDVLIMFTHGHKGKLKDYPLLMATEASELFGKCKHREAHTGHRHTKEVEEQHGVRVRRLSALCPPDDWHSENTFVGNLRASEAFIWHRTEGLVGTVIYTDQGDIERESKD